MILHPPEQIAIGSKPFAMGEYPPQAVAGPLDQVREKIIGFTITISKKGERSNHGRRRDAILLDIIQSGVGEDKQPREMQTVKLAEGNDSVLGIDHAGPDIHGGQQRSQFTFPTSS